MKTWVNYISDPVRNKIKASVKVGEDWHDNLDKLINKRMVELSYVLINVYQFVLERAISMFYRKLRVGKTISV